MPKQFVRAAFYALLVAATAAEAPYTNAAPPANSRADGIISEIDLRDITVGDALRILSTQYGLNVMASESAARVKIALFLHDVRPMDVLDTLTKTYGLWYQRDPESGIIRIYTAREFRISEADSNDDETEIFTMKYPYVLEVAAAIYNLFGNQRVMFAEGVDQATIAQDLQGRLQRFRIIDSQRSQGLAGMGTSSGGGGGGGGGAGGGSSSTFGRSGGSFQQGAGVQTPTGPVTDTSNAMQQQNARQYEQVLRGGEEVRQQLEMAQQTGDTRQLEDTMQQRMAKIYVSVLRSQNRLMVRTRDRKAMDQIRDLVRKLDINQPALLMEVKVLSVDLSDNYRSAFNFDLKAGDFAVAGIPGFQRIAGTALLATVVNEKFSAILSLYEREGRVTELATPMLMTANQEISRVFVGQERPIVTGYTSSNPTATAGLIGVPATPILVPQIQTRPLGTTLLLTPNINADHTVSIRMVIEQSSLNPTKAVIEIPNTSSPDAQPAKAEIDVVRAQTFSGAVLGQDNVALAVGGLIEDSARETQTKTPILGDIPLLGFFFKDDQSDRGRRELIIIIKPHVQETPVESADVSQEFLHNESVHPNAKAMGGNLDIYRNPGRHHDDYELQQRYKFYDNQDQFDEYHRRTRNPAEEPSMPPNAPPAFPPRNEDPQTEADPQDYLGLTRFAALVAHEPKAGNNPPKGIVEAGVVFQSGVNILPDKRLQIEPLESWKKGNLYVTTIHVKNRTDNSLNVNYEQVRGQWLASTIETPRLNRRGQAGDSTYLYLVSKEPFHEALQRR